MKILHCCLSNFYIDNFNYQENMLIQEHVSAGHDVLVLASTEVFNEEGKISYCKPCKYLGTDGAEVVRLSYSKFGPHFIMRKLRIYPQVYQILNKFKPDIIMFHGACAWELFTFAKYKINNLTVKLYVDSHEDFNTSARTFISKNILHRFFYRPILMKCLPKIEKVFCISLETIDFIADFYGCPRDKIEYFPLGGEIYDDELYYDYRLAMRRKYNIDNNTLVFVQAGKFDAKKRLADSIIAFKSAPYCENVHFLIAGVLQDDIKEKVIALIGTDSRIRFLGWHSGRDLLKLLCAADVYVQPGSQSATLQNSICCRCLVLINDVPSHQPFVNGNGWKVKDINALENAFVSAIQSFQRGEFIYMKAQSLKIANLLLDYKKMAKRLTG